MPWRLYVHQPYERFQRGKACIMGDAAHPMMPHQSQGACQAIEDAAALGIIFSEKYGFTNGTRLPCLPLNQTNVLNRRECWTSDL